VLRPDRQEISADGEDVVVCAVEVQDAQGRVLPITDNEVSFKVTGPGKVIGVGNGDPTSHESDIGSTRKAFSGLCMAIVQSTKSAGSIRVDATSPGLTAAAAPITAKAVKLRPQVAVWERAVPTGPGITGLWRPTAAIAAAATGNPMALGGASTDMIFTFRQDGSVLTGAVEAAGGGGFGGGGAAGGAIEDGKIDGASISFRVGNTTYTGTIKGEQIELRRIASAGRGGRGGAIPSPAADTGPRPAVGPAPAGSDPSFGAGGGRGGGQAPAPMILRRVTR
jgi:beta-galactosidase